MEQVVCKCILNQGVWLLYSLSIGSGVGTYMLGLLADEYPKICRFSTCVYPSENNDVVTSPYNVLLYTTL